MAERIEQLTAEQAAQLNSIRDEWIAHGLSTVPANRVLAVAGVNAAYRAAGLEPPQIVIWLDSPMAGAIGAAYLTQILKNPAQVWDQVQDQVQDQVYRACWGQHDYWLSFYDTFRRFGLPGTDRITGLVQTAQHAGWWWPFRGAVILTERPTEIHRDNQGRLHCESGPAMRYPDDFAIYAWHGTRVPADLLDGWDVERILREDNQEIRRCAIERVGWDRFQAEANLVQIGHSVPDPGNPGGELSLYALPHQLFDEPVRLLLARNGTQERDGSWRRCGHVHLLIGRVLWAPGREDAQTIGVVTVPDGAVGYLAHGDGTPASALSRDADHDLQAFGPGTFGPGTYVIRRQREQANEIALVAD